MDDALGNRAIIVGGPTASGKTALGLAIAEEFGGVVINADSKQLYEGLPILSARPTPDQETRVPHRLYGVVAADKVCSAGDWRVLALDACRAAWASGRLPVLVGGTGLYLRVLTQGLSPVPAIPEDIRAASRALLADLGNEAFYGLLNERDPRMAARLAPGNSQRLARAWEVLQATGRSLADWQEEPASDSFPGRFLTIAISPSRDDLYAACNGRFERMMGDGALAEVQALLARALNPALPVMTTLGVPQLAAYLAGSISREAAVVAAQQATRNYAKRQMTWFRHQSIADQTVDAQFSERFSEKIFANIRQFLLTAV
jgi:tRNA dimethylallyltransferase